MARKRKKGLSDRHKRILMVLEDYQENVGYPPSIREICTETGISSTSVVNYYLGQLEEMKYIERDNHVSRGIRLVRPISEGVPPSSAVHSISEGFQKAAEKIGRAAEDVFQIPVLGRIVASEPAPIPPSDFSYFDAESMVDVASSLLPSRESPENLYALEVQGNSMIDAMVFDGDLVIMKPAREARNGELVSVWLNDKDETTLKYFYKENGTIRLQPANPNMAPIYIDDPSSVEIQGKVVMVIRKIQKAAA